MLASFARARAEAHAGSAAFSGAVVAHRHDCRRFHGRGSGGTAPRVWIQALRTANEGYREKTARGHGENGNRAGDAREDRAIDHVVRSLWISRIACREFCFARVCERLPEVPLPGGFYGGDAEQPADGILPGRHARPGRAAARTENQADRCDLFGMAVQTREA